MEMVHKGLVVVFVAIALVTLPLLGSACGEGKAVAQPSLSYAAQPRLLEIGGFSFVAAHPTRVLLHIDPAQQLRVSIYVAGLIDSMSLRRVAAADGSMVAPQPVRLDGSPHGDRIHETYALLTHAPVEAGYCRLEVGGLHARCVGVIG